MQAMSLMYQCNPKIKLTNYWPLYMGPGAAKWEPTQAADRANNHDDDEDYPAHAEAALAIIARRAPSRS